MANLYATALILVGLVLMLLGVFGIWLAMNTPIQLQPLPLIVLLIGVVVVAIGYLIG